MIFARLNDASPMPPRWPLCGPWLSTGTLIAAAIACWPGAASCNPAPPGTSPATSGNLVQNPGFEQSGPDAPAGWTFERRVAHKGTVSTVDAPVHAGRAALQLAPNARNNEMLLPLAIGQAWPMDPFRGKRMYLSAWLGAEGDATAVVGLYAVAADGKVASSVRLAQPAGQKGLAFHQATLELPQGGAARLLILSIAAEGTGGRAFVDDVVVQVGAPPRPTTTSRPEAPPLQAQISIDAKRDRRPIPSTLYGTNAEWVYDGNGLWDARRDALQSKLVELTRELKPSLIRYPGGVFSDFFDWRESIGPRRNRPDKRHLPKGPISHLSFGTDEALDLAERVGANLLVTVNTGTGRPAAAVDWIRYLNKGGRQRVKYWEVGNELYIKDDSPASQASTISPAEYAGRFLEFAGAMRQADAGIRVGAIGGENYGRYTQNSYPDWNRVVLTEAGAQIDFLAVHNAYAPVMVQDSGYRVREVYAAMLAAPQLIRGNLDTLTQQIETLVPDEHGRIRIAVTEWGPFFHTQPSSRWVDHPKTLGSALFVASTLKVFIEHPRVEIANAFKLVDNAFMGWIGLCNGQYVAKAPYLAMQMFTRHFGSVLVASSTTGPSYDSTAVGMVAAVQGVPYLDVVASRSADGRTLYLLGINKHFDQGIRASITLTGFSPASSGTAWTLNGTGIDAHTGTELPQIPGLEWAEQADDEQNPRFAHGAPGEVTLTSAPLAVPADFAYTFPAHSVTCLEIPAGN